MSTTVHAQDSLPCLDPGSPDAHVTRHVRPVVCTSVGFTQHDCLDDCSLV